MEGPAPFGAAAATGIGDGTFGCGAAGLLVSEPHAAIAPVAAATAPITTAIFIRLLSADPDPITPGTLRRFPHCHAKHPFVFWPNLRVIRQPAVSSAGGAF